MVWEGGGGYSLAASLKVLIGQLQQAYPDQGWQTSPGTGTIGDAAHRAEGSASDHNPWLNNTVRALDVAKTANGPDCESLFRMVNEMYAAHDPRVYPNGYAIFNGRITDWDNPGGYHTQQGDPHLTHCHISVSQVLSGYNSTKPWPIEGVDMPLTQADFNEIEQRVANQLARYDAGRDGKQHQTETLVQEAIANSPVIQAIAKHLGVTP